MRELVHAWLDSRRDEMISTLRTLLSFESVAVPAPTPGAPQGPAVAACLHAALEQARALGLCTQNLDGHAGLCDLPGASGDFPLGILCHLDIVPAGDGWSVPPYAGALRDGKLIGRGTTDNKGPFVSALYALAALLACGAPLKHGVRLIAGTCEENGSADMRHCERLGVIPDMVFSPDASYPVVNTEKGILRFSLTAAIPQDSALRALCAGEVVNMVPPYAKARLSGVPKARIAAALARGCGKVRFSHTDDAIEAFGEAAHASTPERGESALTALCALLCDILPPEDAAQAPLRALCSLSPHGSHDGAALGMAARDELSGALTANLGLCALENGELCAKFDIRFPLCSTEQALIAAAQQAVFDTPFTLSETRCSPPHHVPESHPLVQGLLRAYTEVTGKEAFCLSLGGATYVHDMPGGVAFGTVFPGEDNRIHAPDEFIAAQDLFTNAEIFAAAILNLLS